MAPPICAGFFGFLSFSNLTRTFCTLLTCGFSRMGLISPPAGVGSAMGIRGFLSSMANGAESGSAGRLGRTTGSGCAASACWRKYWCTDIAWCFD